jgi:hypothetical protein
MPDLAGVCERALIEGYALVGSFVQYGSRPQVSSFPSNGLDPEG